MKLVEDKGRKVIIMCKRKKKDERFLKIIFFLVVVVVGFDFLPCLPCLTITFLFLRFQFNHPFIIIILFFFFFLFAVGCAHVLLFVYPPLSTTTGDEECDSVPSFSSFSRPSLLAVVLYSGNKIHDLILDCKIVLSY